MWTLIASLYIGNLMMLVLNLPAPPVGAGGDIAARLERIERKIDGLDR